MSDLDLALVRHALSTARQHGYAEVELCAGGDRFSARLGPALPARSQAPVDELTEDPLFSIRSPLVGYFQVGDTYLAEGTTVSAGDIVAVVAALGIANDVECPVNGEVVEVLVRDGDPLEFGQVIAQVRVP